MHMHRLLFSLALLGASTSTLAASASTVDNDATTQIDPDDCLGYDAQNVSWVGDTRLTADLVLRGPCALFGTGTGAGGKDHDVERLKLEVVVETRKFPPAKLYRLLLLHKIPNTILLYAIPIAAWYSHCYSKSMISH